MSEISVEGKAWVFAEPNINTDLIMPAAAFGKPLEVASQLVFSANRPGWVEQVSQGDTLVGGRNFGTGSGRPCAMLLRHLGITALVAESISGLFFRNCVNYGLPVLECPGVLMHVQEGQVVRVQLSTGTVTNVTTGARLHGRDVPDFLLAIIAAGGILPRLRSEGYLS